LTNRPTARFSSAEGAAGALRAMQQAAPAASSAKQENGIRRLQCKDVRHIPTSSGLETRTKGIVEVIGLAPITGVNRRMATSKPPLAR
jgi:hypothetical protein